MVLSDSLSLVRSSMRELSSSKNNVLAAAISPAIHNEIKNIEMNLFIRFYKRKIAIQDSFGK